MYSINLNKQLAKNLVSSLFAPSSLYQKARRGYGSVGDLILISIQLFSFSFSPKEEEEMPCWCCWCCFGLGFLSSLSPSPSSAFQQPSRFFFRKMKAHVPFPGIPAPPRPPFLYRFLCHCNWCNFMLGLLLPGTCLQHSWFSGTKELKNVCQV